ncbi:MAG: prepilin-type N-terminal cleavage/methylation domain-containing protein [Planctomycetota bacterium]|nr:prepilin-type N-terminal cleavage/methylation domain-containing protein [Planctomycetota bacterium]MDA1248791.1 prepilin-type N-terminal cleavage/methylation domain-containing protein [Planctomycetota bacterium]
MRNASSPVRIPNRGFTLVELLLAMALTLTLMTMLYTAMDLHYRFSTMGQIEVERSQIARSLLSQMAADIRSTVYRPEEVPEEEETDDATAAEEETTTVEPEIVYTDPDLAFAGGSLGLFGDSESIVIHINRPRRPSAGSATGVAAPVGNLQTVSYFLVGGAGSMAATYGDLIDPGSRLSGLKEGPTGVARMIGSPLSLSLMEDPSEAATMTSEARLIATEIESLQFEYHDGYEWLSEWDSQAEGRLPNAVGIKIRFRDESLDEQSITRRSASEMTREYNLVVPLSAANPFEALAF